MKYKSKEREIIAISYYQNMLPKAIFQSMHAKNMRNGLFFKKNLSNGYAKLFRIALSSQRCACFAQRYQGKKYISNGKGLLKIADFGTAKQLKKNQQFAMTSVGTLYYLSPQAVRGPKYNSKRDIWGLGCIMFEFCTGKKSFHGNNLNDLIKQILSSEIQQIRQIYSEWFRNLIKSMLEKILKKRPSIENILEKGEIRQAFYELKQQYDEYKDFIYPISELKTKKCCEREEKSILTFRSQSLKAVKNQKNIKLQILEWNNQYKNKPKKDGKVAGLTKLKNRSLKSMIEKRKRICKISISKLNLSKIKRTEQSIFNNLYLTYFEYHQQTFRFIISMKINICEIN